MTQKFDVWVLGPLTAEEKNRAWKAAGFAEAALGSREPALTCEVIAQLLAGVMFDHWERGDAEDVNIRIVKHILGRVEGLARENEALARTVQARAAEVGHD